MADILDDRFIRSRLDRRQQQRLLDRPDLVHVLGDYTIEQTRSVLQQASTPPAERARNKYPRNPGTKRPTQ